MKTSKKVVVIGGGHGQAAICRALKKHSQLDITAIVTVADDGGSTGRLRQNFSIPAMGDVRNVLVSLAESETLFSELLNFRFSKGEPDTDVMGHNLGNLVLTALTDICGGFMEAIAELSKILKVKGKIIPSSLQLITLYARMIDGTIVKGEKNIPHFDNRITEVFYDKVVFATPEAIRAIQTADLIIYGIGSLYTSILPNIIIKEISAAIKKSHARKVYFCNAMSQPGETDGYSVEEHVEAILKHGGFVDEVVVACDYIPDNIIKRYLKEGSGPVFCQMQQHDYMIRKVSLLNFENDLVRHDSDKILAAVSDILKDIENTV